MENKFEMFFQFLVTENKKTNLTRVTEKEDVYYYHFYDSIMCLKAIDKKNDIKLLDIGASFDMNERSILLPMYSDQFILPMRV